MQSAHVHVLINYVEVKPYLEAFSTYYYQSTDEQPSTGYIHTYFTAWFKQQLSCIVALSPEIIHLRKKIPPKKNASHQKPLRSRYIIEEVPDSNLFIPMPQSSQVANHPTPPTMHPTPPPMHPTPPLMHPSPPMSASFTGLLSTPLGCTPFSPISLTTFISPTEYTPYFTTGPSTYFPMPSMQSSGPIHMELGGSNMP
ncbi:unnamed protein product [Vicia faba]|uniref:Uncharacterized protein n=1 Tax=Vicia faba TaxID=3906 RepID=A0AAV1BAD1_VICFA|nr:unnamed protein product [Vicia faba]